MASSPPPLVLYDTNIRIQTGHSCLESHMETSPQISDEAQTGHNSLESHMELSAQSSDKTAIPLRDAKNHTEHNLCQRGCKGSPTKNHLQTPAWFSPGPWRPLCVCGSWSETVRARREDVLGFHVCRQGHATKLAPVRRRGTRWRR